MGEGEGPYERGRDRKFSVIKSGGGGRGGVRAFPSVIMNKRAMMALDRSSELRR